MAGFDSVSVAVGSAALVSLASSVIANTQKVRTMRSQAEATTAALAGAVTTVRIAQVAREGARYDRLGLNATRSIEAATAVTAAIAILSVQLLHHDDPRLTTIGFALAAGALGTSLLGSLLSLSTRFRLDERAEIRDSALTNAPTGTVLRPCCGSASRLGQGCFSGSLFWP